MQKINKPLYLNPMYPIFSLIKAGTLTLQGMSYLETTVYVEI